MIQAQQLRLRIIYYLGVTRCFKMCIKYLWTVAELLKDKFMLIHYYLLTVDIHLNYNYNHVLLL